MFLKPLYGKLRTKQNEFCGTVPEAVFFGSLSAFLLLISKFVTPLWFVYVIALVPLIYKVSRSSPAIAAFTGAVFGCALFGVSQIDAVIVAPSQYGPMILVGTLGCLLFGWISACVRRRFGFYPIVIALLWVGLELLLIKIGSLQALASDSLVQSSPFLHGISAVFGTALVSFTIVLISSIVVAAVEVPILLGSSIEYVPDGAQLQFSFPRSTIKVSSWYYLLPGTRGPPF